MFSCLTTHSDQSITGLSLASLSHPYFAPGCHSAFFFTAPHGLLLQFHILQMQRHQRKVLLLMTIKCLYLFFNFILGSEGKGIPFLILEIWILRLRRKHYLRSHGWLVGWLDSFSKWSWLFSPEIGSSLLHTSCVILTLAPKIQIDYRPGKSRTE